MFLFHDYVLFLFDRTILCLGYKKSIILVGGMPAKETKRDISLGREGVTPDGGVRVRADRARPRAGGAQRARAQEHDTHGD